jgi:hypothetical protein
VHRFETDDDHYPGIAIDAFILIPNHVHGNISFVGAGPRACPDFMAEGELRNMELPNLFNFAIYNPFSHFAI